MMKVELNIYAFQMSMVSVLYNSFVSYINCRYVYYSSNPHVVWVTFTHFRFDYGLRLVALVSLLAMP